MAKRATFRNVPRAALLALLVACLSAASCERTMPSGWPAKAITPPSASQVVWSQRVGDMWIVCFNCPLTVSAVRADLEAKLAQLGYKAGVLNDAEDRLIYSYYAPDGKYSVCLRRRTGPPTGVILPPQTDYALDISSGDCPKELLDAAKPLKPPSP